jgi:hypothetical protein
LKGDCDVETGNDTARYATITLVQRTNRRIDTHVFDDAWHKMLLRVRMMAENGKIWFMLPRFLNSLCIDDGRAIIVADDSRWSATQCDEVAERDHRWALELKHRGFTLSTHVLDFPDGKLDYTGLFLVWGEETANT